MKTLRTKSTSFPGFAPLTWFKLSTLIVCLTLDFIEYLFPMLMTPLFGDLLDLAGLIFTIVSFGWLGLISLLETLPGFDALPIYTLNWLVWYIYSRRLATQLEKWK